MTRNFDLLQKAEGESSTQEYREPISAPDFSSPNQVPAPPKEETSETQKRVNVIFSAQQYQTLRELADKQGINISDVLRQAINITKLVVEANQDGKILIQRRTGEVQQLKLV